MSPLLWIIVTKHTFISSLTIIYCSPSYQRKIVAIITTSAVSVPTTISTASREKAHKVDTQAKLSHQSIIALIITDSDRRNKHYRKYICFVQISSLAFDTFSDFYAPIAQYHKGLFYADSSLANVMSVSKFLVSNYAIELMIMAEVILSFFACVYYRRSVVLPSYRLFNFSGWKRIVLYAFIEVYSITVIATELYFYRREMIVSEPLLPLDLQWVKNRTTFVFIVPDENVEYAN
ncbi:hypothetical protein PENTCL1PPCAC_21042, partial [Pristionchus entomophagus]